MKVYLNCNEPKPRYQQNFNSLHIDNTAYYEYACLIEKGKTEIVKQMKKAAKELKHTKKVDLFIDSDGMTIIRKWQNVVFSKVSDIRKVEAKNNDLIIGDNISLKFATAVKAEKFQNQFINASTNLEKAVVLTKIFDKSISYTDSIEIAKLKKIDKARKKWDLL